MNFSSVTFLFYFLPALTGMYFLCRDRQTRNIVLLLGSLTFYAWGEGVFLALLLVSIGFNHIIGHKIHTSTAEQKRVWLAIGIVANLALLSTFKYTGLITQTLSPLGVPHVEIHLPLGISFFTFQAMSLLVDVYRGAKPADSVLKTGLYISMFPQLVAGPIVRFNEIRDQIDARKESFSKFADGVQIFVLGLAQKVLLADVLAGPADAAFGQSPTELAIGAAWFGLLCFSLQIYYDFAGYSNMAIGLGRFFGFELPRNFEHPYSAKSFRGFWRRWHITLSRWFRDYLYIPLGGSRTGRLTTYRNLLAVFIICGLWHGAAWTFLLWGLWHGAFLIGERALQKVKISSIIQRVLGPLYVCLFVSLGWVLFRAESLNHAIGYWQALFGVGNAGAPILPGHGSLIYLTVIIAIFLAWDGPKTYFENCQAVNTKRSLGGNLIMSVLTWGIIVCLYVLCFIYVAAETHQPFLYFRF